MKLLKGAGRFDRTCRCFQTLSWFIPFGRCSPQFLCQLFTLDTAQYLFVWGRNFQVLPILNILCLFWSLASCILTPLPQHTHTETHRHTQRHTQRHINKHTQTHAQRHAHMAFLAGLVSAALRQKEPRAGSLLLCSARACALVLGPRESAHQRLTRTKCLSVPATEPSPSGAWATFLPQVPGSQEAALNSIKNSHGFIRI